MAFTDKDLLPDEEILLSKMANLLVRPSDYGLSEFAFLDTSGGEAIGGKAHLTNYRLVFAAHSVNRLTGWHSIFLPNIQELRKGWTTLGVMTETQQYSFVMWFNRHFHDAIEQAQQAFGRKELRRLQSLVRDNLPSVSQGLQRNELADMVNGFFLGLQQPLSALAGILQTLPTGEQSSVLEVVSLLKQRPAKSQK
jgi:hypothetical protein